jgi:hypothetical protein
MPALNSEAAVLVSSRKTQGKPEAAHMGLYIGSVSILTSGYEQLFLP